MTIPLKKIAARLLADPGVKAEYDRLAPEFEALANELRRSTAQSDIWLGKGAPQPLKRSGTVNHRDLRSRRG